MKKGIIITTISVGLALTFAVGAFAETTTAPITVTPTKIACVGSAVNARETAVDSAMSAYTISVNSAYSARIAALKQAYTQTTAETVKNAVKQSWSDFRTAMKNARGTWMTTRKKAWVDYRTAVASCKAPGSIKDNENVGFEVSGQ